MFCEICKLNTLGNYKYVVMLSQYHGEILLSRHKARDTWEFQGGHIEKGETPLAAAKRELYEESGALNYEIEPLFDYWVEEGNNKVNGVVFKVVINKLGKLPESEIAETKKFKKLPDNLTYPEVSGKFYRYIINKNL